MDTIFIPIRQRRTLRHSPQKRTERLSPYASSCSCNLKPTVPLDVNIHQSQSSCLLSPQPWWPLGLTSPSFYFISYSHGFILHFVPGSLQCPFLGEAFLGSIQSSSVTQACLTLCNPRDCNTPGFPVLHHLPELIQTHVHWVGDAIQPSHPLSSPSPPALNLSQHQGLFEWVRFSHKVAKVLEFQLQHLPLK